MVDRHLGPIVSFAHRLLGDRVEAEDVAQEVFLRRWANAGRWRPNGARLATWLHRVAYNAAVDRLRRRRPEGLDEIEEPADPKPDAIEAVHDAQVARRVEAALAALPDRQRAALVLCHYEGLGNIEAAAVLEVSVEALESLLSRGRRRLRSILLAEAGDLIGGR